MCTVTWLSEPDSYVVFFNRDELKTRSRSLPPTIKTQNGVRYIAPMDVDGGGTWLGVNESGVTCGLLNNYDVRSSSFRSQRQNREHVATNFISRGLLVTFLLDSLSPSKALAVLETIRLNDFRPFLLTLFAPNQPVALCIWDGEKLQIQNEPIAPPISSSSYDTQNVVQNRLQQFALLRAANQHLDSTLLEAYHASHSERGGAYSVCMHRNDAETVNFSLLRVMPDQVEFHYTPGAPCVTKESMVVALSRSRTV
ncbi:MAG: NRDE family protein [bacterium]